MLAALDATLYALILRERDVLVPLVARQGEVRSLLAFTAGDAARAHLEQLPEDQARAWTVSELPAGDWRAKGELFRAAAEAGATRLDLDPDLTLRPRRQLPLAQAVAYAASYRRATACL